jgi:hypothetical protein
MATSSDDSVELEAKTIPSPRPSHHKSRHRKRIAVKAVFILALVIGILAISDFAYNAYILTDYVQPRSSDSPIEILGSEYAGGIPAEYTDIMQRDAIAAVLAAAFLITSVVISRRIKRHRR